MQRVVNRAAKGKDMKRMRLLVVAAVAVGSLAIAPAASADQNCVGAEGVAVFCVEPWGGTYFSTCVYTGGDTCDPVVVTGPKFTRCDVTWPEEVPWSPGDTISLDCNG